MLGDSMPIHEKKRETERMELSEQTIFTLLSVRRRRDLLRLLEGSGGETTLAEITADVADREQGMESNAAERKAVYVSLYQVHIPRLVEAGVLEYDDVNRTIRLTGPWRQLYAYLEFDPPMEKEGLLSRMLPPQPGRKTN
jgi:hypothetical protein